MTGQGQDQEMVFRNNDENKNGQQMVQKEQEQKFGTGGGGKPKARFGFSSYSSSTICRPDPENPGQQICKNVVQEESIDPETGKRSFRNKESEDSQNMPQSLMGFFQRPKNDSYDQNYNQGAISPVDTLKDKGSQALDRFKNMMHFGEKNNQQPQDAFYEQQEPSQRFQQQHHYEQNHVNINDLEREIFDNFFGGRGGFGSFGGPSFGGHDPFSNHHQQHRGPPQSPFDLIEQMEREIFGGSPFHHQNQGFHVSSGSFGGFGHPQPQFEHPHYRQDDMGRPQNRFEDRFHKYQFEKASQPDKNIYDV